LAALFADGKAPTVTAQARLEPPLQKMGQKYSEAVGKLSPLAFPQTLDVLGDMLDLGLRQAARRSKFACSFVQL
jgi:hypothetical protein